MNNNSLAKAQQSLEGLSVGDAFGQLFFELSPYQISPSSPLPKGPWPWTDDTQMALSVVAELAQRGGIDQDALVADFTERFSQQPKRGYGGGTTRLLAQLAKGGDWRELAPRLFGCGSYGNGAAMRAAPIGAYFGNDLPKAVEQARLSAVVTHSHIEAQAGAIAVAIAAALAAQDGYPQGNDFLDAVLPYVPTSLTKERIQLAMRIPSDDLYTAIQHLGTGSEASSQDTVPFCLWCAAHQLADFEQALWTTAKGLGDVDTTCAIVGGIVVLSAKNIPVLWSERREALPA